nr:hypothetical protein [Sediminibacillus massiliensis]
MHACPLCNGMRTITRNCSNCDETMEDQGKVVDYMGDYSPYLPDDIAKTVDGVQNSTEDHVCVHLFHCNNCKQDMRVEIQEVPK